MKKLFTLFFLVALCLSGFAQSIIDPLLTEEMGRRTDDEKIKVVVIMKTHYDRTELNRRADYFVTRVERREFVVSELKEFATATQYDLRRSLAEMQRNGLTTEPTVLWMANALYFEATPTAIQDLAQRNDIEIIGYAVERNWIPDREESRPASATREITPNVTQVHADQVWALGYTGQGVVVAVIDTGVNYNHLDLAGHLWDGGPEFPHHGYDVYNNDNDPIDDHGHGTHCSGTVCGDGTAGSQTGMAPDATLMCVKCLNGDGNGGATEISNGIQWAVEHGCDMFSMSLGIPNSSIPDRTLLRHTCEAALDAGIVAAIAAGNEGSQQYMYPVPNNVRVPGSCPPPYMDPVQGENPGGQTCSVCIGAVDYNDNAAYFTSQGPVTWQNTEFADYPYNPGIGLIRPDVCAPGVDIKSANYQSTSGYTEMSGTSMATPCVAGCMALMLSKDINLSPEEVCRILEETAVPLSEGKSNTYGFGRVDVLQAVEAVQLGAIKYESFELNDPLGNNNHKLNPGETANLSLTLENVTDETVENVTVTLTTEHPEVTITNFTVAFPTFGPNETITLEDAFVFNVSDNVLGNEQIKFSIEIYVDGEFTSTYSFNVLVYGYQLQYSATAVLNDDNGNGLLNPGETANLRIIVDNVGNELAQSLEGVLSTEYELITLNETEKSYGTIGVEMMAFAEFNVTLDAAAPADFAIPFTLTVTDANGKVTVLPFNYRNSCNVTFSLHDSYGDGWQGNYLTVEYSDGTPAENMEVASGSSATYVRELCSNSTISLTWHNGSWTQECSFEISYDDGTVIYQNSGGFSGTQTFTIDCTGGSGAPEFCDPIRNLAYEVVDHDVLLTWDAPESGTPIWYEIYRGTELLDLTEEMSFTDTNLEDGIYFYCVYAAYDDCQSEYICAEVEISSCGSVQNLEYTLNDELMLTLTWEAPEDPSGLVEYQVYMDGELLGAFNQTNCVFWITPGVHDVYVRTIFEECEKDVHVEVCMTEAVNNLTYTNMGHAVNLSWDALEGVSQYEVYVDGAWAATVEETSCVLDIEANAPTVMVKPVVEDCYALGASINLCLIDAVENLRFVSIDEEGELYFAWDAVDNASYYVVTKNGATVQVEATTVSFKGEIGDNQICVKAHSLNGCDSEEICLTVNVCSIVDGFNYAFVGNEVTFSWEGSVENYLVRIDEDEAVEVTGITYIAAIEDGTHQIVITPVTEECVALSAIYTFEVNGTAPMIRITDVHEGLMSTAWDVLYGTLGYNLYRDGEMIVEHLNAGFFNDTEMPIDAVHCYAVQAIFEKGVSALSEEACANYFTGLHENDSQLSIFPNPTTDKVNVECVGMSRIDVYNVEGKLVRSMKVEDDVVQIDGLDSGVYMLRIYQGDEILTRKVVKR